MPARPQLETMTSRCDSSGKKILYISLYKILYDKYNIYIYIIYIWLYIIIYICKVIYIYIWLYMYYCIIAVSALWLSQYCTRCDWCLSIKEIGIFCNCIRRYSYHIFHICTCLYTTSCSMLRCSLRPQTSMRNCSGRCNFCDCDSHDRSAQHLDKVPRQS